MTGQCYPCAKDEHGDCTRETCTCCGDRVKEHNQKTAELFEAMKKERNNLMMKPTVHLNGTSAGDLFEQLSEALSALRAAETKLQSAAPNGRDYYPQGPDAIHKAQEEHYARCIKLRDVINDLSELQEHIDTAFDRP
jgi:hypothetical protein